MVPYRDTGTDVIDILAGRIIPLRLGYVPVVNRGQRDIDSSRTISSALEKEREFFENHPAYKANVRFCGTPFLAYKLNNVRLIMCVATLLNTVFRPSNFIFVTRFRALKPVSARNTRDYRRNCRLLAGLWSKGIPQTCC
jgi:hypothetical protein